MRGSVMVGSGRAGGSQQPTTASERSITGPAGHRHTAQPEPPPPAGPRHASSGWGGAPLDLDEQERSCFRYGYSVYQAEYSRNLLFKVGAQMDAVFDRVVDRTRSRLDVPTLRTLFGAKQRPARNGNPDLSLRLAALIETPRYDLTLFKVHFGNLTLKAYTKDSDASGAALAGR
ncbi:MAG: hypothetical protein ACRDTD_29610 [Pseudonocardiaceae bacterium]